MKRFVAVLAMATALTGCANPKQIMVNPNTWQQYSCSASVWGWIGAPQAYSIADKCVQNQKVLGNITLEEAELKEPPVFTSQANTTQSQVDKPLWKAADNWEYSVNGASAKVVVEKIDTFRGAKAYFVKNGDGINIFSDSLGLAAVLKNNVIDSSYDPSLQPYGWPLYVGKKWDSSGKLLRNGGEMDLSTHHEVKGFGKIKVQAGEFDAYYILSKSDYGARVSEIWYSPDVKYYVKAVSYTNNGKVTDELKRFDLK